MRNIRLLIEYDGTRYDGWQRLGKSSKGDTIQSRLEGVLSRMTNEPVEIIGSGRTDKGVHAAGQVANFHTNTRLSCTDIRDQMNRYLPEDIGILDVSEAGARFHSRLNATAKTYLYRIAVGPSQAVFSRKYTWYCPEVTDVERMEQGAALLLGEHDFLGFSSVRKTNKSTVRRLDDIKIEAMDRELVLTFTGNGFLYHMVRFLVGTLAQIGAGKRDPETVSQVLLSKDRELAGPMAPPQGLCLENVQYM